MNTLTKNVLQMILHSVIAVILMYIDKDIVYRWEFWTILGSIVLIRLVDAIYEDHR